MKKIIIVIITVSLIFGGNINAFTVKDGKWVCNPEGSYSYSDSDDNFIEGVDEETFEVLSPYFAKDKNNVYSSYYSYHYRGDICGIKEGVDLDTFELLFDSAAKDKNRIYIPNRTVEGVNGEKLEEVGRSYWKDDKKVYNFYVDAYGYSGVLTIERDVESFEVLNEYTKDKNSVYYSINDGSKVEEFVLEGADPESFENVGESYFAKDKNNVYFDNAILEGVDLVSFEGLGDSYYAKDKDFVYRGDEKILDIDPATARAVGKLIVDSNSIFYEEKDYEGKRVYKTIEGVNVSEFRNIQDGYYTDGVNFYFYDKGAVGPIYNVMENVDKNSFYVMNNWYAADTNNMYYTGKVYTPESEAITNSSLYNSLKGKIILTVESHGQAYYISPFEKRMYYLSRPMVAFYVLREQGVGITNSDIERIPVSASNLTGDDFDGDGLTDMFEDAIGTDKTNKDSDGDSYDDKTEVESGKDPNGSDRLDIEKDFTNNHLGKIFLQVENNGEAWYVNPEDGKRYFLGRPADAFNVMRELGLGISNSDFDKL